MPGNTGGPPETQRVAGLFVSMANLGISAINTKIYGVAIFPGDITSNYLTLATTPLGTPDSGTGGLDLMSGSFMVAESGVLPVTLSYFGGKLIENRPTLSWTTVIESDFDGFELQHSTDAQSWHVLKFIAGKKDVEGKKSYEYQDLEAYAGRNYYRLKLVDQDGSYSFSKMISLSVPVKSVIFPNPTAHSIKVKQLIQELGGVSKLEIFNMAGQSEMLVEFSDGNSVGDLDVSSLQTGKYVLVLTSRNLERNSYPFVVVK